mmetsp:Transcript_17455/g.37092  ORF Transcript_17455/g.37092 Transcript_17455/m.37092 type:complete len:226 (-) Transcript_17455:95-772(-)
MLQDHQDEVLLLATHTLISSRPLEFHLKASSGLVVGDNTASATVEVRTALQASDIDCAAHLDNARLGRWCGLNLLLGFGRRSDLGRRWRGLCRIRGLPVVFVVETHIPHGCIHLRLPRPFVAHRWRRNVCIVFWHLLLQAVVGNSRRIDWVGCSRSRLATTCRNDKIRRPGTAAIVAFGLLRLVRLVASFAGPLRLGATGAGRGGGCRTGLCLCLCRGILFGRIL